MFSLNLLEQRRHFLAVLEIAHALVVLDPETGCLPNDALGGWQAGIGLALLTLDCGLFLENLPAEHEQAAEQGASAVINVCVWPENAQSFSRDTAETSTMPQTPFGRKTAASFETSGLLEE